MKSFCVAFLKKRPGRGAEPHDNGLSLVLSLAYFPKERTERIISMYKNKGATYVGNSLVCLCEKIVSVLFEQGAAKRTKNSVKSISRLRARPRAARPWMGGRFLKKATQKLSKEGVRVYRLSFSMRILSASIAVLMALSVSCCSAASSWLSMPRLALS